MEKVVELFKSRRFWAAVASVVVALVGDKTGLTPEQITTIILGIGAWIVGDSLRSTGK